MARIDLIGLTKSFDGIAAVDALDLTIADGEFVSLLGPSGCGKTTTLRCIAGLERPTAGEILFDGRPVASPATGVFVPPEKRQTGMVFQSYALWPHKSAARNVAYPLERNSGLGRADITARVAEMLATVDLAEYGDRLPGKLSGGQQQRVALARALVSRPRLVLFDEPLSNLDTLLRAQLRRELRSLHERLGTTSVYVTHDRTEAMALSDRIVVLRGGVVQQVGPPREIYTRPANRFVADFIGFDNIVKAEVVSAGNGESLLRLDGTDAQLAYTPRTHPQVGATIEVAARAGAFVVGPPGTPGVRATVQAVTYLGEETELRLRAGQVPLLARVDDAELRASDRSAPPAVGEEVALAIAPAELIEIPA